MGTTESDKKSKKRSEKKDDLEMIIEEIEQDSQKEYEENKKKIVKKITNLKATLYREIPPVDAKVTIDRSEYDELVDMKHKYLEITKSLDENSNLVNQITETLTTINEMLFD
jgi:hypothetical protein